MERIRQAFSFSLYEVGGTLVNRIYFYDKNGIIHTTSRGMLENQDRERVQSFNVLHVLKHPKKFLKEETKQAFIDKIRNSKEPVNFSIKSSEKTWDREMVDLYLYVDNEYIKLVEKKTREEITLQDYNFTKVKYVYTDVVIDIDGKVIVDTKMSDREETVCTELREQAEEIFKEINSIAYINKSEFNMLFNKYQIVKRDKPLLVE